MSGTWAPGALEPPPGAWFSSAPYQAKTPSGNQPTTTFELEKHSIRRTKGNHTAIVKPVKAGPTCSRVPAENDSIGSNFFLSEGEQARLENWQAARPALVKEFKQQRRDAVRRRKRWITRKEFGTDEDTDTDGTE
jgi:hypothetical protein